MLKLNFYIQQHAQQVIRREGETASLYNLFRLNLACVNAVSLHVNSIVICFVVKTSVNVQFVSNHKETLWKT